MTTLLRGCNNGGTNGQGKQIHKSSNANNAGGVTDIKPGRSNRSPVWINGHHTTGATEILLGI